MCNGTFKPLQRSEVPEGARIFGGRFVDEIKKAAEGHHKKSRFVSKNYSDDMEASISMKAPTVQRYSQRTAL